MIFLYYMFDVLHLPLYALNHVLTRVLPRD